MCSGGQCKVWRGSGRNGLIGVRFFPPPVALPFVCVCVCHTISMFDISQQSAGISGKTVGKESTPSSVENRYLNTAKYFGARNGSTDAER